jgi:hypothetical protein
MSAQLRFLRTARALHAVASSGSRARTPRGARSCRTTTTRPVRRSLARRPAAAHDRIVVYSSLTVTETPALLAQFRFPRPYDEYGFIRRVDAPPAGDKLGRAYGLSRVDGGRREHRAPPGMPARALTGVRSPARLVPGRRRGRAAAHAARLRALLYGHRRRRVHGAAVPWARDRARRARRRGRGRAVRAAPCLGPVPCSVRHGGRAACELCRVR